MWGRPLGRRPRLLRLGVRRLPHRRCRHRRRRRALSRMKKGWNTHPEKNRRARRLVRVEQLPVLRQGPIRSRGAAHGCFGTGVLYREGVVSRKSHYYRYPCRWIPGVPRNWSVWTSLWARPNILGCRDGSLSLFGCAHVRRCTSVHPGRPKALGLAVQGVAWWRLDAGRNNMQGRVFAHEHHFVCNRITDRAPTEGTRRKNRGWWALRKELLSPFKRGSGCGFAGA